LAQRYVFLWRLCGGRVGEAGADFDKSLEIMKMLFLVLGVLQGGRTWLDLTESEITQLQNIAYGGTNAEGAIYARNILCFVLKDCPDLLMGLDNTTNGRVIPINNPLLELTKSSTSIKAYPNPATDYVTFEYKLPEYLGISQLMVTDVRGKVIHTSTLKGYEGQYFWDTRPIDTGFYFYVLKDDKGEIILSGKISIIK
jgi:hypothetical protein